MAAIGTILFRMCPHAYNIFISVMKTSDPTEDFDTSEKEIFEKILKAIDENNLNALEKLIEKSPSASFSITLVQDEESGVWIQDS